MVKELIILGSIFGSLFVEALELLGCLLGAFLGFLRLSWEASGPQKPKKTESFFRFLKMQLFGSLELLLALLGSSCPLLGPIWSQNGSKMGPKSGPKSDQKVVQKMTPKFTKKMPILAPKIYWLRRVFGVLFGVFFGLLAKRAQDGAQMAQEASKMVPERPKTGLR